MLAAIDGAQSADISLAVALRLLEDHMRGCVQSAIHANHGDAAIEELTRVMRKFAR